MYELITEKMDLGIPEESVYRIMNFSLVSDSHDRENLIHVLPVFHVKRSGKCVDRVAAFQYKDLE